jgi:hypothetical protein
MSTVQEIESAITKLSPEEILQVAEWLENFREDQREVRPEFLERMARARAQIESGECRVIKP